MDTPVRPAAAYAQEKITPVDACVVARVAENGLCRPAHPHSGHTRRRAQFFQRHRLLPRRVEAQLLRHADLRLQPVLDAVRALSPQFKIGDRPAAKRQIIGKDGREKARREPDPGGLKAVFRGKRRDLQRYLLHGEAACLLPAHKAV